MNFCSAQKYYKIKKKRIEKIFEESYGLPQYDVNESIELFPFEMWFMISIINIIQSKFTLPNEYGYYSR